MSGSNPLDDTAATNPTMESNEGLIAALSPESDTKSGTCLCGAFKVQFSSSVVTTVCFPLLQYRFPNEHPVLTGTSCEAMCPQGAWSEIVRI